MAYQRSSYHNFRAIVSIIAIAQSTVFVRHQAAFRVLENRRVWMMRLKLDLGALWVVVIATLYLGACSTVPTETTDKIASYAQKDLGTTSLGQMAESLAAGKPDN